MKLASQQNTIMFNQTANKFSSNWIVSSVNLQTNASIKFFRFYVLLDIVTMVTKIIAWTLWSWKSKFYCIKLLLKASSLQRIRLEQYLVYTTQVIPSFPWSLSQAVLPSLQSYLWLIYVNHLFLMAWETFMSALSCSRTLHLWSYYHFVKVNQFRREMFRSRFFLAFIY